jgi:hypothetical protein
MHAGTQPCDNAAAGGSAATRPPRRLRSPTPRRCARGAALVRRDGVRSADVSGSAARDVLNRQSSFRGRPTTLLPDVADIPQIAGRPAKSGEVHGRRVPAFLRRRACHPLHRDGQECRLVHARRDPARPSAPSLPRRTRGVHRTQPIPFSAARTHDPLRHAARPPQHARSPPQHTPTHAAAPARCRACDSVTGLTVRRTRRRQRRVELPAQAGRWCAPNWRERRRSPPNRSDHIAGGVANQARPSTTQVASTFLPPRSERAASAGRSWSTLQTGRQGSARAGAAREAGAACQRGNCPLPAGSVRANLSSRLRLRRPTRAASRPRARTSLRPKRGARPGSDRASSCRRR